MLIVAVGGAAVGCGAGDSSAPGADAPFVTRLADTLCASIAPCCARVAFPHDVAACRALEEMALAGYFPAGPGPHVTYDPAAASACLSAVTGYVLQCSGPELLGELPADPRLAICAHVLQGTQQAGEPCSDGFDCDTSSAPVFCDQGVCTRPGSGTTTLPVLHAGDPCTAELSLEACWSGCEAGSYCDNSGVCLAQHSTGACDDLCAQGCTPDVRCDHAQRICLPRIPAGGACVDWDSCAGANVHCAGSICAADILTLCTPSPS